MKMMRQRWVEADVMLVMLIGALGFSAPRWGDQGNGTFRNPILWADYSDPDVIRVGSDFYMVASDFHFMPGIPVLHSKDLINWRIISPVYQRLDNFWPDPNWMWSGYGRGCWAPSIRYHEGKYWVYFCTPDTGLYMSTATTPFGPWAPLHQLRSVSGWEDPCPLWDDDGNAYLGRSAVGGGPVIIHRMSWDGRTLLDNGTTVFLNTQQFPGLEGIKLYKKNGIYYIWAPYGGVEMGWQAVLRSTSIYGPYQARQVNENDGHHQGAWVELESGQEWFIGFKQTGTYGRIVHIHPVTWRNGWPIMGVDTDNDNFGEWVEYGTKPDVGGTYPITIPQTSDDFDSPTLGLQWQWLFPPVTSHWSLTERPGFLRLRALYGTVAKGTQNMLTQKIMGEKSTGTIELHVSGMVNDQVAGLCLTGESYGWIGVVQNGGTRRIRMYYNNDWRGGSGSADGPVVTSSAVWLRIRIDSIDRARFFYSLETPVLPNSAIRAVFSSTSAIGKE